jgi:hypothetical protein
MGEWRYSSTHSLTPALDGVEWSASRPGRFTPREGVPGTHWIGGWVGPRAVLDAVMKRGGGESYGKSRQQHQGEWVISVGAAWNWLRIMLNCVLLIF